jgi:hypothetical protein
MISVAATCSRYTSAADATILPHFCPKITHPDHTTRRNSASPNHPHITAEMPPRSPKPNKTIQSNAERSHPRTNNPPAKTSNSPSALDRDRNQTSRNQYSPGPHEFLEIMPLLVGALYQSNPEFLNLTHRALHFEASNPTGILQLDPETLPRLLCGTRR